MSDLPENCPHTACKQYEPAGYNCPCLTHEHCVLTLKDYFVNTLYNFAPRTKADPCFDLRHIDPEVVVE